MKESGNWSNDSQTFSKMCILESQLESKDTEYAALKQENLLLKAEVERLQNLVNTLTIKEDINSNNEVFDRFK
jgi:cell division protein FtsB